jgi:hypothetical protein
VPGLDRKSGGPSTSLRKNKTAALQNGSKLIVIANGFVASLHRFLFFRSTIQSG